LQATSSLFSPNLAKNEVFPYVQGLSRPFARSQAGEGAKFGAERGFLKKKHNKHPVLGVYNNSKGCA
jgi:hypothetical protein